MKIQNMFQKDIERDINGVIKVMQDDDRSLEQELSEYIITKDDCVIIEPTQKDLENQGFVAGSICF